MDTQPLITKLDLIFFVEGAESEAHPLKEVWRTSDEHRKQGGKEK
tara:strand:- start:565 stop:699 length:135 start_codon:yes stop_codon:yes gene_type:complete